MIIIYHLMVIIMGVLLFNVFDIDDANTSFEAVATVIFKVFLVLTMVFAGMGIYSTLSALGLL